MLANFSMHRLLNVRFPIRFKLLLYILPLICVPIAVVSFLTYQHFVNTFATLSRDKLLLETQKSANHIEAIFAQAVIDVDTIWSLAESNLARTQNIDISTHQREAVSSLLNKFALSSPYYFQILFWDIKDSQIVSSYEPYDDEFISHETRVALLENYPHNLPFSISNLIYSPVREGFLMTVTKVIYDNQTNQPIYALMLDIDYNRLIADLTREIEVSGAFALIVDTLGRVVYSPTVDTPYSQNLLTQEEPTLRNFLVEMMIGYSGWDVYEDNGLQVAAYAPIATPGWAIALNLSFEDFTKDSKKLKERTSMIVFSTLIIAVLALILIASTITQSITNLVSATKKIKAGDFNLRVKKTSNDEVGILTDAFNDMVKSLNVTQKKLLLSEKQISMNRFSAGIAHEVRNPLNAMHGAVTYIKRRRANDPLVNEYMELILNGIGRLDKVINDFLHLSRQTTLNLQQTDIKANLRDIIKLFKTEFESNNIELADELGDKNAPIFLNIDTDQINRAVTNIIVNAIQAMPAGGRFAIRLNAVEGPAGGDEVEIIFADNGCGIKPEDMANICDPFFTTKETGSGLGLSIIKGIVEAHQGELDIDSNEGEGTMVIVKLQYNQ